MIIVISGLLAIFSFLGTQSAAAKSKCSPSSTVCATAGKVSRQGPVSGPRSGKRADACMRILTDRSTEIIMVAGDFSGGRRITGKAIKTQRPTSGHYQRRSGILVVEFCVNDADIAYLDAFTICNGRTPGKGYRHIVKGKWLRKLKRTGHVGDYLTLLGSSSYSQYGHIFTAGDYRRRYGG